MAEKICQLGVEADEKEPSLREILHAISAIKAAFPGGDVIEHCKFHEAAIAAKKAEERFWTELKLDLAKKGAWALLFILAGLIVLGILSKFGIGGVPK